ncbi:unnamed protein product [Oncorhynchus mykiss]|uniref:Uncharacterized protein n=1 Tax=Oncorhynchus mykiss TaxID=8022 RepID=A0A060XUV2_ONCMY|nr:unnamed protein product [Oncorhynchus mykiss]
MKPDGCAGVYKKDCLSLLSSHPVEYFRRGIPLLDRGNLGLVLLLRPMGPFSPEACVWPTHTSFTTPGMGALSWPSWLCCLQKSQQCPASLMAALIPPSSMGILTLFPGPLCTTLLGRAAWSTTAFPYARWGYLQPVCTGL